MAPISQNVVAFPFQLTPEQNWAWGVPNFRHWHVNKNLWFPLQDDQFKYITQTVRSYIPTAPDNSAILHQKNTYGWRGEIAQPSGVDKPWAYSLHEHSLSNGILNPQLPMHRILHLNPLGEGAWIQLTKPEDLLSNVLFVEFLFFHGPDARLSVPLGYTRDGQLAVSLTLEDALVSADRPSEEWRSSVWMESIPEKCPAAPPSLPPSAFYVGDVTSLAKSMEYSNRGGVAWPGYIAGLEERQKDVKGFNAPSEQSPGQSDGQEETQARQQQIVGERGGKREELYAVVALPNNVVVAGPRDLTSVASFSVTATWIVDPEREIRQMAVTYDESGNFAELSLGCYFRQGEGAT